MRRFLLSLGLAFLSGSAPSAGAEPSALGPGDRVRVSSPRFDTGPVEGRIDSVAPARLILTPTSSSQSIALFVDEIGSLEVGRGRKRHTKWGALIGGVGLGVAVTYSVSQVDSDEEDHLVPNVWPAIYGVAGAALGAGLGALVGFFVPGEERWSAFPSSASASASPASRAGRPASACSFRSELAHSLATLPDR